MPRADLSGWRRQQIATAVAVTDTDTAYRSDQLVGAGVVNAQGDDLGTIDDIAISPQTGKIAYLVTSRGGLFGFVKDYVPVPWKDFKASPGNRLFVPGTTKVTLDAAPQVKQDQDLQQADFAAESRKVGACWAAHPAS